MKDNRRTFSVIGCEHGHIGVFVQEMLAAGWRCAGIYEPRNRALAERISRQYGVPLVDDRDALLGDEVAIVGCAAINNEKIDIIELCEQHGKHVMADKPIVTSQDDLRRLKAVMDRGTIQIGLLLTERYRASVRKLKSLIDAGELGTIVGITMRKPHKLSPASRPQWHFSKKQNGGIVIDLSIHDFDLLRWLTGSEVGEISGYMAKTILPEYPDFYDVSCLQVRMNNGVLAQLYADWHTPAKSWTWGDCRIFVSGTKGAAELRLEGDPLVDTGELLLKVTDEQEMTRVPLDDMDDSTICGDFLNRIEGKPANITHEDIYKAALATIQADSSVKVFSTVREAEA